MLIAGRLAVHLACIGNYYLAYWWSFACNTWSIYHGCIYISLYL